MWTNKRVGFKTGAPADKPRQDSEEKDLCELTGDSGPWQRRTFLLFLLVSLSCTWHNLLMAFQAPEHPHHCRQTRHNLSADILLRDPMFRCRDGPHPCEQWVYDDTVYRSTLVSEWDLVCDRKWLSSLTKSVYMFGHMVACLVFGQVSDRVGRRPVILGCYALFWCCAMATVFANSIGVFLFLRFLVALGVTAAYTAAFVVVMEVMGPEVRPVYGVACKFGWSLGYASLPLLAAFARDWRTLQLLVTLPWLGMASMWWYLEESPRWLLSAGHADRAESLLLRACLRNGRSTEQVQVPLLKLCSRAIKDKGSCSKKESISDLLKYPNMRRSTFHQFFVWFSISLVYYALTWSTNELEGDPYWNFFLSGLIEFPATLLSMFFAKVYGRRRPLANAAFTAGALLALYSGMVARQDTRGKLLLFMCAKFCVSVCFAVLYVYSSELFPTPVRGVGVGYCSTAARAGAILAPFIAHMGGQTQPHVCYWAYGLLCVTCGLCILLLPETSNRKLPDTLQDGEAFHRNDVIISCRTLTNP